MVVLLLYFCFKKVYYNIRKEQINKASRSQSDKEVIMELKFKHTICSRDVRQFCIHNDLYTAGSNEDYVSLLNSCDALHGCTPRRIVNIAKDIAEHSDPSDAKIDLSLENITYYLCEDVMHTTINLDD